MKRLCILILGFSLFTVGAAVHPPLILASEEDIELPEPADIEIQFKKNIEPIFANNCVSCHGPDDQAGNLRLDIKQSALRGGGSGRSIIPGKSAESRMIQMVAGIDPLQMPLAGDPLSDEEVALLRAWIDQGAPWPEEGNQEVDLGPKSDHWAFQPIERPAIPAVKNNVTQNNPIDAFTAARLEQEGIAPSPAANRVTLIRRLSLDLLGLLPTIEEVEAFVHDPRPDAYERLVDRLLASPHFGERWGRHWLDKARYADSDGYEKDLPRPYAYLYRDWVIDAINRDLPYDQFTIQQLAGDLLPGASLPQKIATGFHRNTLTNREGGVDPEEYRIAAVKDRTATTGAVWMGLTVACAECHNHKYDPISQRDYYELFAFFNRAQEKEIDAPRPEELEQYQKQKVTYDLVHQQLKNAQEAYLDEQFPKRLAQWTENTDAPKQEWRVFKPIEASAGNGAKAEVQEDGSIWVGGENPERTTYTLRLQAAAKTITGLQLETRPDDRLPRGGASRASHANFVLSEVSAWLESPDGATQPITLANAEASFAQNKYPANDTLDGDNETGWAIAPRETQSHRIVFAASEPVHPGEEDVLVVSLVQDYGGQHTLGHFRLLATGAQGEISVPDMPFDVAQSLRKASDQRSAVDKMILAEHYRTLDPVWQQVQNALNTHKQTAPAPPETEAMIIAKNPDPPQSHIHVRGNFLSKGDPVQPNTLDVLPALRARSATPDRLDLARWLVSPENPLAARVAVNNIWMHLFGEGIVRTPEDFGTRGEPPTHPQLLDWLASEFMAQDWRRKAIIKTIVMSHTYRQSSATRHELIDIDPENKLLARQNRYRLEAEIIRDISLQTAGLLHDEIGGPSIRPPLPDDITALGYASNTKWPETQGPEQYRRGMYIFFQRTVPYPMLMTFDCPESNTTKVRRNRSNTPLQALTLLNDPVFFECAQHMGAQMLTQTEGTTHERIAHAFQKALSRKPLPQEVERLVALFDRVYRESAKQPEVVRAALWRELPEETPAAEATAWVAVARTLLNVEEFFTRG